MADYTTITDAQVDPEAPITSELMSALRDNPIAIAEGAAGAIRVTLKAIEVLSAGDTIRLSKDTTISGTGSEITLISLPLIQRGTIRGYVEISEPASVTTTAYFKRQRDGVTTTLSTVSTTLSAFTSFTYDFSVLPGDRLYISFLGPGSSQQARNARFLTNGENIWTIEDNLGVLTNDYT